MAPLVEPRLQTVYCTRRGRAQKRGLACLPSSVKKSLGPITPISICKQCCNVTAVITSSRFDYLLKQTELFSHFMGEVLIDQNFEKEVSILCCCDLFYTRPCEGEEGAELSVEDETEEKEGRRKQTSYD